MNPSALLRIMMPILLQIRLALIPLIASIWATPFHIPSTPSACPRIFSLSQHFTRIEFSIPSPFRNPQGILYRRAI